ncbi:MAG: hypothetical protein D3M94_16030 [Rhodocyclales bacterium GT-UBC]|nr:MAG: hypothetical protein D3M94_16030 [Rhodocyclales bacterium GT-UBC]
MWIDDIRPEDVGGRAATDRLLPESPDKAYSVAHAINHPWYRCQALASVADATKSRSTALSILTESFSAAREQEEPNRVVSVAAWPLRILVKIDRSRAGAELEELLSRASTESHGLRRLHALNSLLGAVAEDAELRARAFEDYVSTAEQCRGWRAERTIAFMAEYIATMDIALAQRLLKSRESNRFSLHAWSAIERRAADA